MPAGNLKITDFGQLEQLGRSLSSKAEALSSELESIRVAADPTAIWESSAASSYQAAFDKWSVAQRGLIESLNSMGSFLVQAAAAYRDTNEAIRQQLDLG